MLPIFNVRETMKVLTFAEAKMLSEQYQHLVGSVVLNEDKEFEVIDHILVCPYNQINRNLFFQLFQELKCPEKALAFYKLPEYEAFVILRELVPLGTPYQKYVNLREFLNFVDKNEAIITYSGTQKEK